MAEEFGVRSSEFGDVARRLAPLESGERRAECGDTSVARSLSSVSVGKQQAARRTVIHVGDAPPAEGYDVIIEPGALRRAGELLNLDRKVFIVTDDGVPEGYAQALASQCREPHLYTMPQGEGSKCLDRFSEILSAMLNAGFARGDCVAAVGGGVVGDLAAFAASCYMRGVDFYNIPTTLLSQIDSSVGGKTAVNFDGVKNAVGSFYFPKKVLIDPDLLKTLDARLLAAGLAEAVKMAASLDESLLALIENSTDLFADLPEIITRSVALKKEVVEQDPYETGLRRVLNFGHTVGHAIESAEAGRYYHGECVAMGMIPLCADGVRDRLKAVLTKYGLPVSYDGDKMALLPLLVKDKKKINNAIRAVYVPRAGAYEFIDLTPEELGERMERYL